MTQLDEFVYVPAGNFIYGPELTYERLELAPSPRPRQEMWAAAFWIAKFPVRYREWKGFLDETGYDWQGRWWLICRGVRGWARLPGGKRSERMGISAVCVWHWPRPVYWHACR